MHGNKRDRISLKRYRNGSMTNQRRNHQNPFLVFLKPSNPKPGMFSYLISYKIKSRLNRSPSQKPKRDQIRNNTQVIGRIFMSCTRYFMCYVMVSCGHLFDYENKKWSKQK